MTRGSRTEYEACILPCHQSETSPGLQCSKVGFPTAIWWLSINYASDLSAVAGPITTSVCCHSAETKEWKHMGKISFSLLEPSPEIKRGGKWVVGIRPKMYTDAFPFKKQRKQKMFFD